jgi:inner membrane protein involved in colicin E2 resistance
MAKVIKFKGINYDTQCLIDFDGNEVAFDKKNLLHVMYAKMFLGKLAPALTIGVVFAASYLLNFILLRMEDFALLAGTIILAVILGVLMFLTGKINRSGKDQE